mmetsp:Transcript_18012/g.32235  ORF Transcript_18012/g.32235 Transcript_18012/m.32235 type:complete len:391 (+) Transcript_18012:139-1311(+)
MSGTEAEIIESREDLGEDLGFCKSVRPMPRKRDVHTEIKGRTRKLRTKSRDESNCSSLDPLSISSYFQSVKHYESNSCSNVNMLSSNHPGQNDNLYFDRSDDENFDTKHPPKLSPTQIAHLKMLVKKPERSWYHFRMMPIFALSGKSQTVFGVESLLRREGSNNAPWMDLVQLNQPSNKQMYNYWKLGEIQHASDAVMRYPLMQTVFVNVRATDFLDDNFYHRLLQILNKNLVFELEEHLTSWPEKDSESFKVLIERISNLRKLGVRFALDDIGENNFVDSEFIDMYGALFDVVKFSFQQCSAIFVQRDMQKTIKADEKKESASMHMISTWKHFKQIKPDMKFVIEYSITEDMTKEITHCPIWGSPNWLVQGGITGERAYPPHVFQTREG